MALSFQDMAKCMSKKIGFYHFLKYRFSVVLKRRTLNMFKRLDYRHWHIQISNIKQTELSKIEDSRVTSQ
jgi:hypothetical protein